MKFFHVDVFSSNPMQGNGLTVVFPEQPLSDATLLDITREFRQFETIFIFKRNSQNAFPARIFTMDEELGFAGHPVLGAGAVIHHIMFPSENTAPISLDISGRILSVESQVSNGIYQVTMNQGVPEFINTIAKKDYDTIANALNITKSDLDETFPVEVVSTGLPYLLVPVKHHLADVRINRKDFETFLSHFGAKFVYLFNLETLECRTWDNHGTVEDIATGSAAGPLCASLVKNGRKQRNEIVTIQQGRFVHRPSIIEGWVSSNGEVRIRGDVSFFATGEMNFGIGMSNMNKVVDSTKADFAGWLALAAEVENLFGPMVSELSFHEALSQKIMQGQAFCIRQDDSPGGSPLLGGVVISKEDNEIIWLAVSERQRGNGLGDLLLSYAFERLNESQAISVVTFDSRVEAGLPARHLYVKHGFIDKEQRSLNPAGIPIVLMVRE